jgi:hypothetical protein
MRSPARCSTAPRASCIKRYREGMEDQLGALGLVDAHLFTEPWTKEQRAEHITTRLAFIHELWASWGSQTVTLYRGAAVDGPLAPRSPTSFVSATFSSDVASAHFEGGPTTQTAALWRQQVPISRLFMTFLETSAMSERFNEAEAILIGDPANRAF